MPAWMRTTCSDSRYARPSTSTVGASNAATRSSTGAARCTAFTPIHGRARPVERVAVDPGRGVVVARHRVEMAREHDTGAGAALRPRHDVLPHPRDVEAGGALLQARLDDVGERGFLPAHRRDRAQLLG